MRRLQDLGVLSVLFVSGMLGSCDGGGPGGNVTPSEVDSLYEGGVVSSVGTDSATISNGGYSVHIPSGSLSGLGTIRVARTNDATTQKRYLEGFWHVPIGTDLGEGEFRIKLRETRLTATGAITVDMPVPTGMHSATSAGGLPGVWALGRYTMEEEDRAEDLDVVTELPATLDLAARTLSVVLDASAFEEQPDGAFEAILRITPPTPIPSGASRSVPLGTKAPGPLAGQACTQVTERPDAATRYARPLLEPLRIIGPFSEPDHSNKPHSGIDFLIVEGKPVLAVRGGHVERIQRSQECPKEYPECEPHEKLFYAVIRHPDGSATRYLHLQFASVGSHDAAGSFVPWSSPGSTPEQTQLAWVETDPCRPSVPVSAGIKFALSGVTGTILKKGAKPRPHLHFEAGPGSTYGGTLRNVFNPILLLGEARFPVRSIRVPSEQALTLVMYDHSGLFDGLYDPKKATEILVRRKKVEKTDGIFYSVVAQGSGFEEHSNWPVVTVEYAFEPTAFGRAIERSTIRYPDLSNPPLNSDLGNIKLLVTEEQDVPVATDVMVNLRAVDSAELAPGSLVPGRILVLAGDSPAARQTVTLRVISSIPPIHRKLAQPFSTVVSLPGGCTAAEAIDSTGQWLFTIPNRTIPPAGIYDCTSMVTSLGDANGGYDYAWETWGWLLRPLDMTYGMPIGYLRGSSFPRVSEVGSLRVDLAERIALYLDRFRIAKKWQCVWGTGAPKHGTLSWDATTMQLQTEDGTAHVLPSYWPAIDGTAVERLTRSTVGSGHAQLTYANGASSSVTLYPDGIAISSGSAPVRCEVDTW